MTEAAAAAPPLMSGLLNRDTDTRMSEQALDAAWDEPTTRVLQMREGKVAVRELADGSLRLAFTPSTGLRSAAHLFLGRTDRGAIFALDSDTISDSDSDSDTDRSDGELHGPSVSWQYPLVIGEQLDRLHREILTVAFALANWHRSAAFSPADGETTTPIQGGWARVDAHGREHFPRTDPAVIVLVEHENRLLLGSNVLWESGRFSLLAGFIEAGESAEQTVVREVFEEAGVRVDNVRYVASQAWPFPRSIMLGFRASLVAGSDPEALVPEAAEISELRWFTRDELRDPQPGVLLPMRLSIARWLIDLWIAEGDREH